LIEPLDAEAQAVFEGVKLTVAPVFKVTVVVADEEHPLFVTVTVYVPAFTAVIFGIVGF
jgi:hypothetical protein